MHLLELKMLNHLTQKISYDYALPSKFSRIIFNAENNLWCWFCAWKFCIRTSLLNYRQVLCHLLINSISPTCSILNRVLLHSFLIHDIGVYYNPQSPLENAGFSCYLFITRKYCRIIILASIVPFKPITKMHNFIYKNHYYIIIIVRLLWE